MKNPPNKPTENINNLTFPDELFDNTPEIVDAYMKYATPLSDTPNEFLLMPFLTLVGTLIGRKRYIKAAGRKIRPIIWTVLFAGSSTMRKSTSIGIAKKPLQMIESAFQDEYEENLSNWKQEKREAQQNDIVFEKPEPNQRTLFAPDGFSDLTFWESLRDNGSLVSVASEFTGLWTELNKPYSNLSEFALKLFDGEGGRRVTKSGGDIRLNEPMWSIIGATTIDNFRSTLTSTQRGSGFLQRIIPICMEKNPKSFKSILNNPDENISLREIISLELYGIHMLEESPMGITEEAKKIFDDWSHRLNNESKALENKISDIGGYHSRLNIYGLKFALIFQTLKSPNEKITPQSMNAAITLCGWIKNHIHYMLDKNYIFDKHYADRVKIREIIQKQPESNISRTKLMNNSHFSAKRLDIALKSEKEADIVGENIVETNGKNRTEYFIKDEK